MGVRTVNALKGGVSYVKSMITGIADISGMPVSASAELTNYCNLKCPECPSGTGLLSRERGFMDMNLFDKLITELESYLFYLTLYFQGEPMMHPMFFSFLERVRHLNTVVSTNGHFLSGEYAEKIVRSGLKKIIVSVDGTDQETYSSYRINGDLALVLDGLKNLAGAMNKSSSSLKLEIQFLVNRKNEHQIPSVKLLAHKYNANLKLKSMQIINKGEYETWIPSKEEFSRYKREGNKYRIKNNLPDRCARLWFNPVITWDGKVVPCCFDKNTSHIMGDLNEKSFRDIWFGTEYRDFRQKVFSARRDIEICRNCTSGLRGVRY